MRLLGGGGLTTLAQTIEGIKTFASKIVAAAGIEITSGIWSTLGAGASDVCVKVGSSVVDGSVNANSKLFVVRTGVGGTEVEKLSLSGAGALSATGQVTGSTVVAVGEVKAGSGVGVVLSVATQRLFGGWGLTGAADVHARVGAQTSDASTHASSTLLGICTGLTGTAVTKAAFSATGLLSQLGTDSTGSPGAATINKPLGKSSIAAGSASVVITNSLVTTASHIVFSPHARDATCIDLIVVPGSGSFTISGAAAATSDLPFSWEVKGLL